MESPPLNPLIISAKAYRRLFNIEYHFVISRKQKAVDIFLSFEKNDFKHLSGLHKLKGINQTREASEKVFDLALTGRLTNDAILKSPNYNEIHNRLVGFAFLEQMIDNDSIVFKYNNNAIKSSVITADYMIEGKVLGDITAYCFLNLRKDNMYKPKSFFLREHINYANGQSKCTVLLKEKHYINTDNTIQLFRHPNYRET